MNNLFKGYNTGIPSKSYYFYSEPELQNNKCTNGIRQNSEMFKGMDYYSIDKNLLLMDITTAQLLILRTATAK